MTHQDARYGQAREGVALDTPLGVTPISRANTAEQTTPEGQPIYVLRSRFIESKTFATTAAPAYLLGLTINDGRLRCRLLVLSKSGRYIDIWQPRYKLMDFELVKVTWDMPGYTALQKYYRGAACDELANLMLIRSLRRDLDAFTVRQNYITEAV